MFEREIQFIYDFNQNRVRKLGSFLTFAQLKTVNLHPAILQYISGEIDFLIFEDRQKLLNNSLFDYSGDVIGKHFLDISNEIKNSKRFSLGYIEKLILHASSFNINFLAKPNWVLMRFVFEEEKEKPAAEIKQILNYLYYYPHLKKIITSYVDKKKFIKFEADAFQKLLMQIDRIALESDHSKVFGEALDSMGDFFNIGVSKKNLIPVKAVELFLKDKSLMNHAKTLTELLNDPNITKYEIQDYRRVLDTVVFETEEIIEEKPEEEKVFEEEPGQFPEEVKPENSIDGEVHSTDEIAVTADEETPEPEVELKEENEPGEISTQAPQGEIPLTEEVPDIIEIEDSESYEISNVEDVLELAKEEAELNEVGTDILENDLSNVAAFSESEEDEIDFPENSSDEKNDILDTSPKAEDENLTTQNEKMLEESEPEDFHLEVDEDENDSGIFEEEISGTEFGTLETGEIVGDDEENISAEEETEDLQYGLTEESPKVEAEVDDEIESLPQAEPLISVDEPESEEDELKLFSDEEEKSESALSQTERDALEEMHRSIENEGESMYDGTSSFDITELLENKKMSRILDVVFDYDMEDFTNAIEKITESSSREEAFLIIDKLCETAQIGINSKEAKTFKSIVSEFFDHR